MLLDISIHEKSFGPKVLYKDLHFSVEEHEKVGLIGRNGTGKTTLFNMIAGLDKDFDGTAVLKKGSVLVSSRQEHHGYEDLSVLAYIQGDLPEFAELEHIISTYPLTMGDNARKIQDYSDALERFNDLGYFQIEDEVRQALNAYQIGESELHELLGSLSGGQKRMVELIKVQRSRGHIALIDEPTNHMDYLAKNAFIDWLRKTDEAVIVITHDRDVLKQVDRIIEIRDGTALSFKGNYDDYLRANTSQVTSQVNEFDITQKRIKNLQEDVIRFQRMKERARDPGTIRRFKSQEQRARQQLAELQELDRPSFWIDKESTQTMNEKMTASYDKYKAQNIRIRTHGQASNTHRLLIQATNLSLGYDHPLFADINFSLHEGERVRLHGRNGAGKTTIVQAIMAASAHQAPASQVYDGTIKVERELPIGLYEQEIDAKYLKLTLADALEAVLAAKGADSSGRRVKQLLSDYLFDPATDGGLEVSQLSGGQKARFQLIAMLANDPLVLILDEPTNHLDLPSIEELEHALQLYKGAILYISHDSYFSAAIGGAEVIVSR